jgi:hypothetical protein
VRARLVEITEKGRAVRKRVCHTLERSITMRPGAIEAALGRALAG